MADILIRGMEMPTDSRVKLLVFPNGYVGIYDVYGKYLANARAIPLQEGHGRLGDLDALEDAFIRYYLSQERKNNLVFAAVEIKQHFADMIADFPTIVPAEGGNADG